MFSNIATLMYLFTLCVDIGESFQDDSLIQDFEADFPQKVILKMLISGITAFLLFVFSVFLRSFDHLNLKL